jgi:hypothetical protein
MYPETISLILCYTLLMDALLKTRCTKGHLIISQDKIAIEMNILGYHQANSITLFQVTGVEVKQTQPDILGMGQATVKIFGTGNQTLVAERVKLKDARKAEELIHSLKQ